MANNKFIFSQFYRLDIWDQGFSGVGTFWDSERISSRILSLAWCRWLFSPCVFISSSTCVYVCVQVSSFYKDTSWTGLRAVLLTSFYLSCFFKDPISNCSHLMGYRELRANIGVLRQNLGHNKWRQYLFPTMISFSIAKTQSSTLLYSPSPADPICVIITSFLQGNECYSSSWFSRIICGFFVLFSFFCYLDNLNEETPT